MLVVQNDITKRMEVVEDTVDALHQAVDYYRADIGVVKGKVDDHGKKIADIEQKINNAEKVDVSLSHILTTLKENFANCKLHCQEYIKKIDDVDRRVHTMETKFDVFASSINKQLSDISALLRESKESHKANEAAIQELKKQIQDLSWINDFRDTLLKRIYHLVSMGILALIAVGMLGFVALKPYIDKVLEDKFVTRQEIKQLQADDRRK